MFPLISVLSDIYLFVFLMSTGYLSLKFFPRVYQFVDNFLFFF